LFNLNGFLINIILPIGLSFYIFEIISYLSDIYYKKIVVCKNIFQLALFIAYFPKIMSGPIVRAGDFLPQISKFQFLKLSNISEGFQIFLFGAFKKVVIADRLGVCVNAIYNAPNTYNWISVLCAVLSYSIQIYCDFSGYTDMAIGISKMLGIDMCSNFNMPYISRNPSEFWKRWHISLSSWFKDYVYIPLGGSRKGEVRTYFNTFLTMFISGLWHGASWTFVFWGALHGVAQLFHRVFAKLRSKKRINSSLNKERKWDKVFSVLFTYLFICFTWIFFRADSFETAFIILRRIITFQTGVMYIYVYFIIFSVILIFAYFLGLYRNKGNGYYPILKLKSFKSKLVLCIMIWIIIAFSYVGDTAFIYQQF
jgi:alginate O-acetyltransferase complex protein AlgI